MILIAGGSRMRSQTFVELSLNKFKAVIVNNLCKNSIQKIQRAEKIMEKHIPFYNLDCTNGEKL